MPTDTGLQVQPSGEKILVLDACESITGWSEGATGTDNLELSTTHRSGRFAIAFDKIAGGSTASISRRFTDPKSLSDRAEEAKLILRALIPDVTNVDKVHIDLGDGTNYNTYTVDDSELASGVWERIEKKITEPDAVVAAGMNTLSITWMQVRVVFDAAGNTLADMVLDEAFLAFESAEEMDAIAADIAAIRVSTASIDGKVATEATLATMATEATVATLATEATAATLATEATAATLATEATLSALNPSVKLQDGAGTPLTSATVGAEQALGIRVLDAAGNQVIAFVADPVGLKEVGGTAYVAIADQFGGWPNLGVMLASLVTKDDDPGGVTGTSRDAQAIAGVYATAPVDIVDGKYGRLLLDIKGRAQVSAPQLPASLGAKTGAGSLSIVHATDDAVLLSVAASDAAAPTNTQQVGAKYESTLTSVGTTGDLTVLKATKDGRLLTERLDANTRWQYNLETGAAQANTVVKAAPGANLQIRILGYKFSADGTVDIRFEDEDDTLVVARSYMTAKKDVTMTNVDIRVATNKALELDTSAAVNHTVCVWGDVVPA